jgi:hypothetical protein
MQHRVGERAGRGRDPIFQLLSPEDPLPPCDARLVELHRLWQDIRPGQGVLPGRQHFDPLSVPKLLRWIYLVEIERERPRFRYRLLGTEHVFALGRDVTGEWLDEAHPAFASSPAYPQFLATADGQIAYYRGPPTYYFERDHLAIERMLMPLARDGKTVDMVLGVTVFSGRS